MKVALVYDWVVKWGGAERVLLALHEIWPQAPLYTSVYWPAKAGWAQAFQVVPSFLNKIPWARQHHEWLAPLLPLAFESFNLADYDLVISVTSAFAKGVITQPTTRHLCYCLTPTRFLWSDSQQYFGKISPPLRGLRHWDQLASWRPDQMIAVSKAVQQRIRQYYDRESSVIYPPVDTARFKIQKHQPRGVASGGRPRSANHNLNYFLVVSRLVKYKRVGLVVEAFNQLGWPLKIVGTGHQERRLKALARPNIEFLGQLTDEQLLSYYQKCCGLIFPQVEDFGLVAVEAQACGRPVVAFRAGGALETVLEGKTGVFFDQPIVASLVAALKKFVKIKFRPLACRQNALRFRQQKFKKEIINLIT